MSDQAQRNYDRYVGDIGFELDIKGTVMKKKRLRTGTEIQLEVGKTFNEGAHTPLSELVQFIGDVELRQRVEEHFVIEHTQ